MIEAPTSFTDVPAIHEIQFFARSRVSLMKGVFHVRV